MEPNHRTVPCLDAGVAERWATTVVRVLGTAWPYNAAHMSLDAGDCDVTPERLHPCFHGSLDWHSSCHMQWSALVLLDSGLLAPASELALADVLDQRLTSDNARVEAEYLRRHPGYERPYGWAWLAVLAARARASRHPNAGQWAEASGAIAEVVAANVLDWLPRQPVPVRHGVHPNSAFGLALLRDGFEALGRRDVVAAIDRRSRDWFGADTGLPVGFEPSGTDFLSPSLSEADLMRRVLDADQFRTWLDAALPGLGAAGDPLLALPPVHDLSDGQLVHLFGLALSRAGQLRRLTPFVDADRRPRMLRSAGEQEALAARQIDEGHFMSTHWLVSFALLAAGFPTVAMG